MVYIIIAIALFVIIAPIVATLPSDRQKSQMAKRKEAMAKGIRVELTHIDDPDPDPEKYLSNTGRPLPRRLAVIAYRVSRQRPDHWREMPGSDWAFNRRSAHMQALHDKAIQNNGLQEEWAPNWQSDLLPETGLSPSWYEFFIQHLGKLPEDVVRVEENEFTISVYWHEISKVEEIVNFLLSCRVIEGEPGATSDDH